MGSIIIYVDIYRSLVTIRDNHIDLADIGVHLKESDGNIMGNEIKECIIGIQLYHSDADITDNEVFQNRNGVYFLRNSPITMGGTTSETNEIHDSGYDEVVFFMSSAPSLCHYNKIYDDDPQGYDLMLCKDWDGAPLTAYDVENNYWGSNADLKRDLEPPQAFDWDPEWNGIPIRSGLAEIEDMFALAKHKEGDDDYSGAESIYKNIISNYPDTHLAKASAKSLLSAREHSSNDYNDLKEYYLSEENMTFDEEFESLQGYLVNYCDIILGNYPEAITWFEAIIDNPPSETDSICAVIDAGYVYLLMEATGNRNSFLGMHKFLKPATEEDYYEMYYRLVSELLGVKAHERHTLQRLAKPTKLYGNYPNPFNPKTTISFDLRTTGNAKLSVYNIKGQLVKILLDDEMDWGHHSIVWDGKNKSGNDVSSGVYFYRLETEKDEPITRKMIMMK